MSKVLEEDVLGWRQKRLIVGKSLILGCSCHKPPSNATVESHSRAPEVTILFWAVVPSATILIGIIPHCIKQRCWGCYYYPLVPKNPEMSLKVSLKKVVGASTLPHYSPCGLRTTSTFLCPQFFRVGVFMPQSLPRLVPPRAFSTDFPSFSPRFFRGSPLPLGFGLATSATFHSHQNITYATSLNRGG